jgi:regulatory protein
MEADRAPEVRAAGRCRKSIDSHIDPPADIPGDVGDPSRAREAAYRFLARRIRSREEVARRLRDRGFRDEIVDQTLDDLARLGYLDDARFAEIWVRTRMGLKGYGRNLLRRELLEKGVSKEAIRQALSLEEVDEEEAARRVLARRFPEGRARGRTDLKGWRSAYNHLFRRGFPSDLIRKVLRERWEADAEETD